MRCHCGAVYYCYLSLGLGARKTLTRRLNLIVALRLKKDVSSDLRVSLETAQSSNSQLVGQLQRERELVQEYQAKAKTLNKEFSAKQETIRILEREDKVFSDWSNTDLPFGIVGLLNSTTTTADHRHLQN